MSRTTKFLVAGALLLPALVFAHEGDTANTAASSSKPARPAVIKPIKDAVEIKNKEWHDTLEQKRASTTNAIKEKREELHDVLKEKRASTTEAIKAKREEILTDLKAKREEFSRFFKQRLASTTEMIKERREALKDEIQKRRGEIIELYYSKVAEIFRMRIDRLSSIADKLGDRIIKLEEERGVDLSGASDLLEKAQGLIDDASAKADEFSSTVPDAITPETAASAAEEMKALRREVDAAIKAARDALVEAIRAVKAALPQPPADTSSGESN